MRSFKRILMLNLIFCNLITFIVTENTKVIDDISNTTVYTQYLLNNEAKNYICGSPNCVMTSNMILDYQDTKTEPCDDFYSFTCGKFDEIKTISPDEYMSSLITDIRNEQIRELHKIIEDVGTLNYSLPFSMVYAFYDNCMNLYYTNPAQIDRIHHLLEHFGGWPVLENGNSSTVKWNALKWNLQDLIILVYRNGYPADNLFKISIEIDRMEVDRYIISIEQPAPEFPKEFYNSVFIPMEFQEYYLYMKDVALLLGGSVDVIEEDLLDILNFEKMLSNITLSSEQLIEEFNPTRTYTLSELHKLTPDIDWAYLINNYFNSDIIIEDDEVVLVRGLSYFERLNDLIVKTPLRTSTNYLIWKMLAQSAQFMTGELRLRHYNYYKSITGQSTSKPLWHQCTETTIHFFPGLINALLSKKHEYKIIEEATADIKQDIEKSLMRLLNVSWLYEDSKHIVMDKITRSTWNIGSILQDHDEHRLSQFYNGGIYSDNYYETFLLLTKKYREYNFSRYKGTDFLSDDWFDKLYVSDFNAFYDYRRNSIYLPFGTLNRFNIDTNVPFYLRFAGIGVVIGRLMSQIYDVIGRQLDANGKLIDWCKNICNGRFQDEAKCIEKQYNHFRRSMNLTGIDDVGQEENFANVHGVNIAYKAYASWLNRNNEEIKLPGLEKYTGRQMFWIWYGTMQCTKYRPTAYNNIIRTGYHIEPKYPVNGPLINSNHFSHDFNCNYNNFMSMERRCIIW